jgi:serpin B
MPVVASLAALALSSAILAAQPAESAAIVESNTGFAADLYGKLAQKPGNLFFSPYSISTALAMTWGGARTATATEMASALHFGADAAAVHRGFSLLQKDLAADPKAPFELAVANRLFAQLGKKFAEPFLAVARDQYAAPVE